MCLLYCLVWCKIFRQMCRQYRRMRTKCLLVDIETSTRLKSRDSRTPRRGSTWRGPGLHYSRRTPAGIAPGRQTAGLPGMVCPLVLHDSLPVYGLSFRGVTDQRPVSCTCNRRSGFCPLWPDQHVFWETVVYGILRQDLPFIRIQSMPDVTVRRPSSSWSVPPASLQTVRTAAGIFPCPVFPGCPCRTGGTHCRGPSVRPALLRS